MAQNKKQTTIENEVSLEGVGLHTGKQVTLTFKPAAVNTGYVFKRVDLEGAPEIPADVSYVANTQRGTSLEKNGVSIQTSEHVLAACVGLEIDNVLIEMNESEPPIMDGSSKFFVEALEKAGKKELEEEPDALKKELIQVEIDKKTYGKAGMQLVAAHRMREVTEWSNFKKIYNDGTFDDKNVDTHQLLSYKKIMKNRKNTLTPGSSQPEVFNVLGQMQSIERIEEERKALGHEPKKAISETPKYGKQS